MLNVSQYGIFTKVTSRQAKIADVCWRLIISKATAVAVGTSWGKAEGTPGEEGQDEH